MNRTFINSKEVPIIFGTEETKKCFNNWKERIKISNQEAINILKFLVVNPISELKLEESISIEISEEIENMPVSLTSYDKSKQFVKVEMFGNIVEIKFHTPTEIWVKEGEVLSKVEVHKPIIKDGKENITLYLTSREVERIVLKNGKQGIFDYFENFAGIVVVEMSSGNKIAIDFRTEKNSCGQEEELFKNPIFKDLEDALLSADFEILDVFQKIKAAGFAPKKFYRFKMVVVDIGRKHESFTMEFEKPNSFKVIKPNVECWFSFITNKCYYKEGNTSYTYDMVSGKETIEIIKGSTIDVEAIRSYIKEFLEETSKIKNEINY